MKNIADLSILEKCSLGLVVLLLLCLLPMPYGFYTIVRLATAIIAGCWTYRFYNGRQITCMVVAGAVALLFQPFVKIVLDKLTWNIVDVLLACGIVGIVFFGKN